MSLDLQAFLQGSDALGEVALQQVQLAQNQPEAGLLGAEGVFLEAFGGGEDGLLGLCRAPEVEAELGPLP